MVSVPMMICPDSETTTCPSDSVNVNGPWELPPDACDVLIVPFVLLEDGCRDVKFEKVLSPVEKPETCETPLELERIESDAVVGTPLRGVLLLELVTAEARQELEKLQVTTSLTGTYTVVSCHSVLVVCAVVIGGSRHSDVEVLEMDDSKEIHWKRPLHGVSDGQHPPPQQIVPVVLINNYRTEHASDQGRTNPTKIVIPVRYLAAGIPKRITAAAILTPILAGSACARVSDADALHYLQKS